MMIKLVDTSVASVAVLGLVQDVRIASLAIEVVVLLVREGETIVSLSRRMVFLPSLAIAYFSINGGICWISPYAHYSQNKDNCLQQDLTENQSSR